MDTAHLSLHHKNECQSSVNDCLTCNMDNPWATLRNRHIMIGWAAFLGNILQTISVPPPKNERQRSVNNVWSSIFDIQGPVQPSHITITVLAAFNGKKVSNNITSASQKSVSMSMSHRFYFFLAGCSRVKI
jgi:hypothetical protein